MAQKAKESKAFNIRMELKTSERLNDFCEDSGQTKTTAVERAINMYIDDYNRKMEKLREDD